MGSLDVSSGHRGSGDHRSGGGGSIERFPTRSLEAGLVAYPSIYPRAVSCSYLSRRTTNVVTTDIVRLTPLYKGFPGHSECRRTIWVPPRFGRVTWGGAGTRSCLTSCGGGSSRPGRCQVRTISRTVRSRSAAAHVALKPTTALAMSASSSMKNQHATKAAMPTMPCSNAH
jgi:hypothetical protein